MTPTPQPDRSRDHELLEYARRKAADLKAQNEGLLRYANKLADDLRLARLHYSAVSERLAALVEEREDLKFDKRCWMTGAIIMIVVDAALRAPILDAPIEPADVLPFAEIFRDADAQAEDAIGFLIAKKEEVSPRVLAANMRTLAELFEAKAKKAMSLARSAERAKADPAEELAA